MQNDFVKELEFLGFVTRLKRVSDAMLHDGRRLYKELGMDIEPNWFVILKLLESRGDMPLTEIAERIGFAHPSVISIVNKMTKTGYLKSEKSETDSRKRMLSLTPKAREKMPEFERVWAAGVAGVKKMLSDVDALGFLEKLEERVFSKGFKNRTLDELNVKKEVEIITFEEKYAGDFADLNYEWIEQFYEIEDHDREVLDHPVSSIIQPGGQIFFALIDRKAVGTVALIPETDNAVELAKMGVNSKFRGFSIGEKLINACLEYAKNEGFEKVVLESNRKLIPAINLYKKVGFRETPLNPNSLYKRADIRMELIL